MIAQANKRRVSSGGSGLGWLGWLALMSCLLFPGGLARADELLRWKFAVGQKFKVELTQNSSAVTEYETKSSNLATETRLELSWEIVAVEAGVATVNQRLDRLALQLDLPTADGVGKVLFDSADAAVALNLKPELQARLQGLVGTSFQLKVRDSGQVESVVATPETLKAWQAAPASTGFRELLSPEGLARLFADSSLPLPEDEAAAAGGWSDSRQVSGPWGNLEVKDEYRLGSPEQYESQPAVKIAMSRKLLSSEAATAAEPAAVAEASRLRNQEASGEWYFDPEAGQLLGGKVVQRIEAERTYREEKMKTVYRSSSAVRMRRLN